MTNPPVVTEAQGAESNLKSVTLAEVLRDNAVVEVLDNDVVIVTPKQFAETPDLRELGAASVSPFTSTLRAEYNRMLMGVQGLRKYDEMRKNDGTVRGSMRQLKTPVLGATWFIEAASESTRDQNVADFVWWNLTEALSAPFSQVIQECLLMLDFGYYMFEKVWGEGSWNNRNVMFWKKLGPRHPIDVIEWYYDKNGGPASVDMTNPDMYKYDPVNLKIEKLLVFTFDKEAGNIEGISVLRSAFKHWYYKEQLYKIDAIQKERHGIGVPVITLPPNFTPEDRAVAQAIGRNLRTNEQAHVVLPPNWSISFAELHGNPVDALASAQHHDLQIQKNIMAPFLDKPVGSDEMGTFNTACRFIADIIADTFNKYAIPQLVNYNYSRVGVPKLRHTNIGSKVDLRTLSFALRNFIGAGAIRPDDRLEKYLRDVSELPPMDPKTTRIVAAPQLAIADPRGFSVMPPGAPAPTQVSTAPVPVRTPGTPTTLPNVGPPRQSTAAGLQTNAGNNGRVGIDQSGAA